MAKAFEVAAAALMLGVVSYGAVAGTVWSANGHEYEVVSSNPLVGDAARSAAQALGPGWDLARIGSVGENAFVTSLLDSGLPERAHFRLGATDQKQEGVWVWTDGTAFTYTNWWAGEPNNFQDEDFAAYDLRSGSWAWNDVQGNEDKLGLQENEWVILRISRAPGACK
jgi:hypothetical protein